MGSSIEMGKVPPPHELARQIEDVHISTARRKEF